MWTLGPLLVLATSAGAATPVVVPQGYRLPAREVPVQIRGNEVLASDVYLTVIALARGAGAPCVEPPPASTTATTTRSSTTVLDVSKRGRPGQRHVVGRTVPTDLELAGEAQQIAELISDFLLATGYELAHVAAYPRQGGIVVEIDEGRLDKIIFLGQNVFRALELQVSFDLPGRVFNRTLVEQKLTELKRLFSLKSARFEIIPVDRPETSRIDIEQFGFLRTLEVLRPGEAHELRISLEYPDRSSGLQLGIEIGSVDGFALTGSYLWRNLAGKGDRLELNAAVGARVADPFSNEPERVGLSRVRSELTYSTPPFLGTWLRGRATVSEDLQNRRRSDLSLTRYFYLPIRGLAGLGVEVDDVFSLDLVAGLEQGYVFGVTAADGETPPTEVTAARPEFFRGMGLGRLLLRFNPGEVRVGHAHFVELNARLYPAGDKRKESFLSQATYRFAWALGYDELRVRAEGTLLLGDVQYFEQVPLGYRHLRAAYQDVFVDRAATGGLEYRFSLTRDLLKLGAFTSASVARGLGTEREKVQALGEVGLGLHVLVFESIEANLYAALGVSSIPDRDTSFGVVLDIQRAF